MATPQSDSNLPDRASAVRRGHGWWPYVGPYFAFLLAGEVARRTPESAGLLMLVIKPAVPLALIAWFYARGAYPELRRAAPGIGGGLLDVALGLALAALWAAPYVFIHPLRPSPEGAFDPMMAGPENVALVLGLRFFGYALVTPLFEELFIRSFVMRISEVYGRAGDFRDLPIGFYSLRSFVATTVIFTMGHVPWEWWVAIPWVMITNWWIIRRRSVWALILLHGTTNAALLALAYFGSGVFPDADGAPLSLWFFV